MLFSELAGTLKGWNSKFPPASIDSIINEALDFIYQEYRWSFLYEETYLRVPKMITTGTVDVTKFSQNIVISANLKTILDAIELIAEEVRVIGRQIRVMDGTNSNFTYFITDYDSANSILVVSDPYMGETAAGLQFKLFKSLYPAPTKIINGNEEVTDFKNFLRVLDMTVLRQLHLDKTVTEIDNLDYYRLSYGEPNCIVPHSYINGKPYFELYPTYASSIDRLYKVKYLRKGRPLTYREEVPEAISRATIMAACKIRLYEWAEANKTKDNNLASKNWLNLIGLLSNPKNPHGYTANLDKDIARDESLFPKAYMFTYYEDYDYFDWVDYAYPPHTLLTSMN